VLLLTNGDGRIIHITGHEVSEGKNTEVVVRSVNVLEKAVTARNDRCTGLDHPGAMGYLALSSRAGTEDSVAANHGDGVGDRCAAGPVPQCGADDGGRGAYRGRGDQLGWGRATGTSHQADQHSERR
jgi:hypothetical protein